MKVQLRGGPFDGADVEVTGWLECLILRDRAGKLHRYLYLDAPQESEEMYGGYLQHSTDFTGERAACLPVDPQTAEACVRTVRDNVRWVEQHLGFISEPGGPSARACDLEDGK